MALATRDHKVVNVGEDDNGPVQASSSLVEKHLSLGSIAEEDNRGDTGSQELLTNDPGLHNDCGTKGVRSESHSMLSTLCLRPI